MAVIAIGFSAFGLQAISGLGSAMTEVQKKEVEVMKYFESEEKTVDVLRNVGYPMGPIDRAMSRLDEARADEAMLAAWDVHDLLDRSIAHASVGKSSSEAHRIRGVARIVSQQRSAFEGWANAVVIWEKSVEIQGSALVIQMGMSQAPADDIVAVAHEVLGQ